MKTGQANLSQRFMRVRVVAQGATVVVLCTGGVMMGNGPLEPKKRQSLEEKILDERAARRALLMEAPIVKPISEKMKPSSDSK